MLAGVKKTTGELLGGSILEPHSEYRAAIGVLGIVLPPAVWIGARSMESSISAYYYTGMRDWFVGTLWVIGVFLFFYKYSPTPAADPKSGLHIVKSGWADALLGKIAGVAAVVVALAPTAPPPGTGTEPPIIGMVHGIAAAVLFGTLSLFPLVLFSQSRQGTAMYRACGVLMLVLLAALIAYALGPESMRQALAPWRLVFVLEWALIWTFGFSWFVKGVRTGAGTMAQPAVVEESELRQA